MSSRRRFLATVGALLSVGASGCTLSQTTTGTVVRKDIHVGVRDGDGSTVRAGCLRAVYSPERGAIVGEYADIVAAAVDDGAVSVPERTHERLDDRFGYVRYDTNVVPAEGDPKNGSVGRASFNDLSVGGKASVSQYMKQVDDDHSASSLRIEESRSGERRLESRLTQYDWEDRVDDIRH